MCMYACERRGEIDAFCCDKRLYMDRNVRCLPKQGVLRLTSIVK